MMIILLLIGLVIGAGAGYFLAPPKYETITETITVGEHPLQGKTIQIGCILVEGLEPRQTFYKEIIEKDINKYVSELGLDTQFDFVIKDAEGYESMHLNRVQELDSMGIQIFIGGSRSGMAEVSREYVNENDMLMVSDSSTYPELALAGDNLYRFCVPEPSQAEALGDIVYDFGVEYVVVLDDDSISWTPPFYKAFEEKFEENGGEILGRTLYHEELEPLVSEAIKLYGEEKVGAVAIVSVPGHVIKMVQDYPALGSIYWFSHGEQGYSRDLIDESDGVQTQLRFFSPEGSVSVSGKWKEFEERYIEVMGEAPIYWEGTAYDAAWCIALSVLETGSVEGTVVRDMLPSVSARYYGVTGWCELNIDGDRMPYISDIWGYALVDGEHTYIKFGEYNFRTRETSWDHQSFKEHGIK
jgi:branched-chain amino acid transport system substrate-binding protein